MTNIKKMSEETGIPEYRIKLAFLGVDSVMAVKTKEEAIENYRKAGSEHEKDIAIKQIAKFFRA